MDIGEEYSEITILGWEEYWVTEENLHPCWWVGGFVNLIVFNDLAKNFAFGLAFEPGPFEKENNILTNIY